MKLSQFYIFMIGMVIFALVSYGIITYSLPATTTQNEKIFLYPQYQSNEAAFVKITDMEPNSFGFFMYPSSYQMNTENAYQTFLLIRLPAWLGGAKDDITSFRAYSAVDLSSHCIIKYWPQNERQRIEDPCGGNMYRSLDGYLYAIGGNPVLLGNDIALPRLDLYSDSQGYLYVKPPTFTQDKNGAIGIGRKLSIPELNQSNSFIAQQQPIMESYKFRAPPKLTNGFEALTVDGDSYQQTITYASQGFRNNTMTLVVQYCSCINPEKLLAQELTVYSQLWKLGNQTILASPSSVGPGEYDYRFVFYKNGYKVTFLTGMQFESGMVLTLDNFFDGAKISDLQKIGK
jgi:hypothetical protein